MYASFERVALEVRRLHPSQDPPRTEVDRMMLWVEQVALWFEQVALSAKRMALWFERMALSVE